MIRIRGPVGTLRVLMVPGESDASGIVADGMSSGGSESLGAESEPMGEAHRDQ